jgi:hypothetical protein
MSSEDERAVVEGLGDNDLQNYIEDEGASENEGECAYLTVVEQQNDALMEGSFKKFLSLCKMKGMKADHRFSKEIFQKESYRASSFTSEAAEIVKMDLPELTILLSELKNAILGMRMKLAKIVDKISESEADPKNSLPLINLRIEVLLDYWTYLSLLVLKKVFYIVT